MFSGIVEGTGKVRSLEMRGAEGSEHARLEIQADYPLTDIKIGDSIAVNGCCLTITSHLGHTFWADVSEQTMRLTSMRHMHEDSVVNLERAMCYGARVGGHLVQGHVDGVGRVLRINQLQGATEIVIDLPIPIVRYVIAKGSISVDGVSLTVAGLSGSEVTLAIIPHTLQTTNLGHLQPGASVNLEADLIGKYLEKLAFSAGQQYQAGASPGTSELSFLEDLRTKYPGE